jgi:hypothetical protein
MLVFQNIIEGGSFSKCVFTPGLDSAAANPASKIVRNFFVRRGFYTDIFTPLNSGQLRSE